MEYVVTILLQLGFSKLFDFKLGDILLSKYAIAFYVVVALIILFTLLNDDTSIDDEEKNPLGISEFDANVLCFFFVLGGLGVFLFILMLMFR